MQTSPDTARQIALKPMQTTASPGGSQSEPLFRVRFRQNAESSAAIVCRGQRSCW
jgi:hypothetical protein